jgi:major membrane immunogen (membrane-anchored lipoprotein)
MIKNIQFTLIAIFISTSSLLVSCGSEDDAPASAIVGTWNYDSYSLQRATINGQPSITYLTTVMGLSNTLAQQAQVFFLSQLVAQSGLSTSAFTFNSDGTYVVRNNGVQEDSGTYSLRNNNTKLALTSTNGNQEFDVKSLTGNRLVLVSEDTVPYDVNMDGTPESVAYAIEVVLTK